MLRREDAVLVVVDVQTRLLPQIDRAEAITKQIVRLIRGFQIVGAQVLPTEQYRKGLGGWGKGARTANRRQPYPSIALAMMAMAF